MSGSADWKGIEERIAGAVKLGRRPVAVAFLDAAPAGVARFDGTEPSGCSFWRLAAAGRVFYTVPENHFNCAVGAYTHNIALSPGREKETEQTLKMMFDLGYVRPEDQEKGKLIGVHQMIQKPYTLEQLQETFDRYFARDTSPAEMPRR